MRGASTLIVGTTSQTAPNSASRSVIVPACSRVRGTRIRQPKSGLVSNQDSCSRSAAVEPTTAISGLASRAALAALAAATSGAATVRCSTVVPCSVSTTGVCGSRPASSRAANEAMTPSGVPSRIAVTSEATASETSTPACAGWITWIARVLASVSGTPA